MNQLAGLKTWGNKGLGVFSRRLLTSVRLTSLVKAYCKRFRGDREPREEIELELVIPENYSMGSNLAAYFADHNESNGSGMRPGLMRSTSSNVPGNDDDDMGPSVSMAVQADDEDGFQRSTFNLKRTRSMGYFDDYIDPTKKMPGKSVAQGSDDEYDDDDYNTDSDSESDSYSDDEDNDGYEEEEAAQTRGISPSVSPPPADADNYLMPQDDNDLVREPERHVDYLSHEWNEWDISQSWKYIILKKKKRAEDLVNAARLENASWRTWAKARNHLKTVSPEIVNWSKDSDVTWLYGPIVRDRDDDDVSDVERGYGSDDENSKRVAATKKIVMTKTPASPTPKPILKKRTVSEILAENSEWKLNEARKHISEMKHASVVMDPYGGESHDVYDDYDALAAKVNAQYYRHGNQYSDKGMADSQIIDPNTMQKVPQSVPEISHLDDGAQEYPESAQHIEKPNSMSSAQISSALANLKSNLKSASSNKTRHIHFNDRVEQCMALARNASDSEFSDEEDEYNTLRQGDLRSKSNDGSDSSDNNPSSSSSDESDEDDDNAGLFINPTTSRKADTYHLTDSSSQTSSVHSRTPINPIIKLLPATTLNYGSDDEASDNEEYNGYGNAVSHNVNTYRGYDYMYDYNSVYTGDTSSFLPGEGCDVVDVPDGLDLRAAMAADNASTYEMGHAVASSHGDSKETGDPSSPSNFMYDLPRDSDFDSDEQFIENSNYRSSDDDDDALSMKRTVSLGKGGQSNSLRDLRKPPSSTSVGPAKTRSFITGKSADNKNKDSTITKTPARGANPAGRPRCLKRNSSSSSFIFNSDSDEDDEGSDGDEHDGFMHNEQDGLDFDDTRVDENVSTGKEDKLPSFKPVKPVPPQSTVISPDPRTFSSPGASQAGDKSKSIRLKNTSSSAEVGASDVAISGSFSPRSDSVKSVVSNQGIVDKETTSDLREMNEHLKAYHLDDNKQEQSEENNESIHKMMQNARGIAHKYLHSWKNQDPKEDHSKD